MAVCRVIVAVRVVVSVEGRVRAAHGLDQGDCSVQLVLHDSKGVADAIAITVCVVVRAWTVRLCFATGSPATAIVATRWCRGSRAAATVSSRRWWRRAGPLR